nr:aminoacyl-histidine dipeptidase [Oscillospiraceae bacterium]
MLDFCDFPSSEKALRFFEEFSKIPRGSGNTKAIADYLVSFANTRGLEVIRDESDNVIIRKPATAGYENRPGVIFQGHTDIVALKTPDCPIDMAKEGLELYRDGDFLRARGTTLGADDGVAMAYALAVLDSSDLEHPEFEAVFTSDEEIGLLGATALDASALRGRMLINIDSDEEGIFTAGCAGGARVDISLPIKGKTHIGQIYTLTIGGLLGGHSGIEIDKNRANSIKVAAEILSKLEGVKLGKVTAGSADNAIPSDAIVKFTSASSIFEISAAINDVKEALPEGEGDAKFNIDMHISSAKLMDKEQSANIISLIKEMPNGVTRMSEDIEGLVETSLNMGIIKLDDKSAEITISVRSAKGEEKAKILAKINEIACSHGASVSVRGEYPAWEYRKESHLRDVMCRVYRDMYAKDAKVVTIHAGLECGIFSDKMEGLDCVSIGPDNRDIHTPDERLSLSSFDRVYGYLINVLKNL